MSILTEHSNVDIITAKETLMANVKEMLLRNKP